MMNETRWATQTTLPDGRSATIRPLQEGDVEPLTALFLSLSEETRRRYGPHPFDRETAERLCANIDERTVRFVAVVEAEGQAPEIVGYMILTREIAESDRKRYGERLQPEACASFAPVIADAYQSQGIGGVMARHVLRCARDMGLCQVILMGGVQATNERAKHFYDKLGFRRIGEFWTHYREKMLNYDMVLESWEDVLR
jgi:ribosomal protein S18 acetylase RimI-like enzyme